MDLSSYVSSLLRRGMSFLYVRRISVVALVLITVQNSSLTLLLRYSRGVLRESYIPSVSILFIEFTKLLVCAAVMWRSTPPHKRSLSIYKSSIKTSLPSLVPAAVYLVQNTLQFFALQNLEAGVFSVLAQLKTLTTALFSVTLLRRSLSPNQWRALCLLVLAAILVQTPLCSLGANAAADAAAPKGENDGPMKETASGNSMLGAALVLIICTLSGFSGVYTERVLKTSPVSLWERNFQLASYSIVFSSITAIFGDGHRIITEGPLTGFSVWAFLIVLVQAAGGLITAVVIRYTDNIIKSFAMAVAICLTGVLSGPLFGNYPTPQFWIGAMMVALSIFNYGDPLANSRVNEENKLRAARNSPTPNSDLPIHDTISSSTKDPLTVVVETK